MIDSYQSSPWGYPPAHWIQSPTALNSMYWKPRSEYSVADQDCQKPLGLVQEVEGCLYLERVQRSFFFFPPFLCPLTAHPQAIPWWWQRELPAVKPVGAKTQGDSPSFPYSFVSQRLEPTFIFSSLLSICLALDTDDDGESTHSSYLSLLARQWIEGTRKYQGDDREEGTKNKWPHQTVYIVLSLPPVCICVWIWFFLAC